MAKETESTYFVGLEKPNELRRALLESTRDVVDVLKKFERFKSIREQRVRYVERLKSDMGEISKLISKLRSELPKTKLKVKLHRHEKAPEQKKVARKEAEKPKKKEMTELDKLEAELSAIEGKLKSLS